MRLWSIHPRYLDSKGLVALWLPAFRRMSHWPFVKAKRLLAARFGTGSVNGTKAR
jgi:hypothetical protein